MSWHVETDMLESYAQGTVDDAAAFSLEAHLLGCAECRARVTGLVDAERLEDLWEEIDELLDTPKRGPIELLLVRAGISEHFARLLAATPSLSVSWLSAVALALAFAVLAAYESERGLLLFLALAPLLPLAGVAAAYGPGLDPTYEIGLASPLGSFQLMLIRATAVLITTTVLAGIASLALLQFDWRIAAWLLPALGLTTISLALATYVSPLWASGAPAFLWISAVTVGAVVTDDRFVAFRAPVQVALLAATLLAALVVVHRREHFETASQR